VVGDRICVCLGTPGSRAQPARAARRVREARGLPHFTLLTSNLFRGDARRLVRGLDTAPAPCGGYASASCKSNAALGLECNRGACDNRVLQRRAFKRTVVRPLRGGSNDQWSVFMDEDGLEGDVLEEYVGEGLTLRDFELRIPSFHAESKWYFCSLVPGVVIDASHMGSYARFINHSCAPNAALLPRSVATYRKLAVVLLRDAPKGEEVTLSYDYDEGELSQVCWCRAPTCTGFIRRLPVGSRSTETELVPDVSPEVTPPRAAKRGRAAPPEPEAVPSPATESDEENEHVTVERWPTEEEVIIALEVVRGRLSSVPPDSGPAQRWQPVWGLLDQLPDPVVRAQLLQTSQVSNLVALLFGKGPPFVLGPHFQLSTDAVVPPSPPPVVIDLTDSPSPSRLDEGASDGRVRAEARGGECEANAEASSRGQGLGCE